MPEIVDRVDQTDNLGFPVHPFHEEGVMAFQNTVRRLLSEHVKHEEQAGEQILPSERAPETSYGSDGMESKILSCTRMRSKEFSW